MVMMTGDNDNRISDTSNNDYRNDIDAAASGRMNLITSVEFL